MDVNISLNESSINTYSRESRSRHWQLPASSWIGPASVGIEGYERTSKYQDVILPELSVVAAWVMVMKMAYGLDEQPRSVHVDKPEFRTDVEASVL